MLIIELTKFYFIILVGEGGVFHIHIFVRMSEISLKRRYIPTIYHHIFYIFFFAKSMSQHKRFLSKRTRLLFRPFSSSVYLLVPLILLIHARRLAVMGLSLHLSNLEPIA